MIDFKYKTSKSEKEAFDYLADRLGLMMSCRNRKTFQPYTSYDDHSVIGNIYHLDQANNYWLSCEGKFKYRFNGRYWSSEEREAFGIVLPRLIYGLKLY